MTTITAFGRPETLEVIQLNEPGLYFDLAYPNADDMREEVGDIISELVENDVYDLFHTTRRGDVWVDAGSHVGLFSMYAMLYEAEVAAAIDMDGELAWCAWQNMSALRLQLQRRNVLPQPGIVPQVATQRVSSADFLIDAAMLIPNDWEGRERTCLKMDIQGSERDVLVDGGAAKLAEAYDLLVMEWHHEEDPSALLEEGGWQITRMRSHVDVLLNCPTRIVWATTG